MTAGTCHCQVQDVELVRKVGQGAFGVVYHARVHQTDYACKSGPQNCTNHGFVLNASFDTPGYPGYPPGMVPVCISTA